MANIPLESFGIAGRPPRGGGPRLPELEGTGGNAGKAARGGGPIGLVLAAIYTGSWASA